MRTDASGKLILKSSANEQQENIKNSRKTLKVLQHAATDKENLVGRPQRSGKELLPKPQSFSDSDLESKKKIKVSNKYVQTTTGLHIDVNDLTSEAGPSENYWEVIAEKRRLALDESLLENQNLHEENQSLREENRLVKEMLEESKNLVEVLTEMLSETENGSADNQSPENETSESNEITQEEQQKDE